MNQQRLEEYKRKIEEIGNLPTIPTTAFQVMHVISDENSSIRDLEKIIANDPPMAAKIIKVANSSYYRTSREITSLHMALVILGMEEIRNIVFAVSLYSTFHRLKGSKYFLFEDFWIHSVGVGKLVVALTRFLKLPVNGSEFLAGLLHDIGRLLLQSFFQEDYDQIYIKALEEQEMLYIVERKMWGFTHQEIGGWLAQKWNIPSIVREVIENHHTENFSSLKYPILVALVQVADHLTRIWGVSVEPLPRMEPLETLPAYQFLIAKYPLLKDVNFSRWLGILNVEIDDAENFVNKIAAYLV